MLKKSLLLALLIATGSGIGASASTEISSENINVSTQNPSELIEKGTSVPTNTHNVKTQGRLSFSGQAGFNTLYTNYLLTGDTWYNVSVSNLKDSYNYLTVQPYKSVVGIDKKLNQPTEIRGQKTVNFTISGGLTTSDKIYLAFNAPSHFSGWIE